MVNMECWQRLLRALPWLFASLFAMSVVHGESSLGSNVRSDAQSGGPTIASLVAAAAVARSEYRYTQALGLLLDAQDIDGSDAEQALVQAHLGATYLQLGRYRRAESILTGVLTLPTTANLQAAVANDLGVAIMAQGRAAQAVELFQRAQSSTGLLQAQALGNELKARIANQDLDLDALVERAIAANLTLFDDGDKARLALTNAASLEAMESRLGFAPKVVRPSRLELLSAAEAIAGEQGDAALLADARGGLAGLYRADQQTEAAIRYAELASLAAQASGRDEVIYRWEWLLGDLLKEQQQDQRQLLEAKEAYARAVAALNRVRPQLISSRRVFTEQIEPVYTGYADVLLRAAAGMSTQERAQTLLATRGVLEDLKQAEVEDYFANQCVAELNEREPDVGSTTALIYPIILNDRIEVLVQTGDVVHSATVPVTRGQIKQAARAFRLNLQSVARGDDYLQQAQQFYDWLIRPVHAQLRTASIENLVIIPDGALRTIPIAALHDGQRHLVEQFSVSITPSMRYTKGVSAPTDSAQRMFVGGLADGVQGFVPLPHVLEEVGAVSQQLNATVLTDAQFRLGSVERAVESGSFSVLHLATHGEFKSDYRESFLLTYDDRLTLGALQSSLRQRSSDAPDDVPLDLIVLSACNTAVGDERAALGLAGVAIQSGANSAIASLWPVSDPGTAQLMSTFYNRLRGGDNKSASLRAAQLNLLAEPQFSHPAFWAAFTLIGGWQ